MRLLFLIGLLTFIVAITACSSDDSPTYSEAEVIAIVKQDLPTMAESMLLMQTGLFTDVQVQISANKLAEGKWTAEYQGDNVWEVYCFGKHQEYSRMEWSTNPGTATFHVYESSRLVEFVKQ